VSIKVVLHRSQNIINMALTIRSMKNFGLQDLRLVSPREFDPHRIDGIAHGTSDVVERVEIFDTLDEALADCHFVAGLTARQRAAKRNVRRARDAAPEILAQASAKTVAILMGPEDNGLGNEELDRCDIAVTIDTTDDHPSLNVAHAFTVMAYELYVTSGGARSFKPPRHAAEPATHAELEQLFADIEVSLEAIDFFKTRKSENILRSIRDLVHRAEVDSREARLVRAIALEFGHFLRRNRPETGTPPE
jgi:TrmH family RNA methyltransferase